MGFEDEPEEPANTLDSSTSSRKSLACRMRPGEPGVDPAHTCMWSGAHASIGSEADFCVPVWRWHALLMLHLARSRALCGGSVALQAVRRNHSTQDI